MRNDLLPLLLGLAVATNAAPRGAGAEPCNPAERPSPQDARDDGTWTNSTPPFAAILADVFVSGCGEICSLTDLRAERCGSLEDDVVEIPNGVISSATVGGPSGSQATADLHFLNGGYAADLFAIVPPDARIDDGITGAGAYAQLGFRDVLDVTSSGTDDVLLSVRLQLGGTWSNWKCLLGVASRPPLHEVQLWIHDTAKGHKVVDYDVQPNTEFAAAIDETFVFSASPTTALQAHLFVSLQAFASTANTVGDNFCEGGESVADFDAIRLTFENPDPSVTVVPRSGIRYSQTVPEPGSGSAAAAAALLLRCVPAMRARAGARRAGSA